VSYTFKQPVVRTVRQDLDLTFALNEYREANGLVRARNAYSWWKYVFAALVAGPNTGQTMTQIRMLIKAKLGVNVSPSSGHLLSGAVRGKSPCRVRREYTKNLPAVTAMLDVVTGRIRLPGQKGAGELIFGLKNQAAARRDLIKTFPELEALIAELEK
jgi:hypothetical protein